MEFILEMVKGMPWFADVMMLMGVLRLIFKPLMSIIGTVVSSTPLRADDDALKAFKESRFYQILVWAIDYFASVKLPK